MYRDYSVTVVSRVLNEHEASEAPGALLKHYAPLIPTYILRVAEKDIQGLEVHKAGRVIVIDFNGVARKILKENESTSFPTYISRSYHT